LEDLFLLFPLFAETALCLAVLHATFRLWDGRVVSSDQPSCYPGIAKGANSEHWMFFWRLGGDGLLDHRVWQVELHDTR
jgi:hypothetical protein